MNNLATIINRNKLDISEIINQVLLKEISTDMCTNVRLKIFKHNVELTIVKRLDRKLLRP